MNAYSQQPQSSHFAQLAPAPRVPQDLLSPVSHVPSQPPVSAAPPPPAAAAAPKEEKKPLLDSRYMLLPVGIFGAFAVLGIVEAIVALFILKTI